MSHATAIIGIYVIAHTNPLVHVIPPEPRIRLLQRQDSEIPFIYAGGDDGLGDRVRYENPLPPQNEELDYGDDVAAPEQVLAAVAGRDAREYAVAREYAFADRVSALHAARIRREAAIQQATPPLEHLVFGDDVVMPLFYGNRSLADAWRTHDMRQTSLPSPRGSFQELEQRIKQYRA